MKIVSALFTGALLLLPGLAAAQTPAPSPSPTAAASATPSPLPTGPVDTPTLTAPTGWTPKDYTMSMGSFTLIKMWYKPNGGGDNINLGYAPNPTGADVSAVAPVMRTALTKIFGPVTDHAEKLCNGTANGWLFHTAPTMGALHMIVDEVVLTTKHDLFGATYTRMSDHPEDPAAHKAIDSLCAESSSASV